MTRKLTVSLVRHDELRIALFISEVGPRYVTVCSARYAQSKCALKKRKTEDYSVRANNAVCCGRRVFTFKKNPLPRNSKY